jgi:TPR repeat protein
MDGRGVERDEKKAKHCYELAAMGGNVQARYNLGNSELRAGNLDRAIKQHWLLAARGGGVDVLHL